MKKVLIGFVALAAVLSIAAPVLAAGETKFGLGYFRPEAPVGGRVWVGEKLAIDLGIGFVNADRMGATKLEKKTSFAVDAGVPLVLAGDATTLFFVRPGILFRSTPRYSDAENDWVSDKEFWVSGSLGVEHFFSKWFSLQAAHGIAFCSSKGGEKGSKSVSSITSEAFGISNIGFHFYFLQ